VGLRVALVLEGLAADGEIGQDVPALARALVLRGVELTVICPPELAWAFAETGATVTPLTVGVGVAAVTALRHALREPGLDVVHAHGLRAGLAASLAKTNGTALVVGWPEPVHVAGASGLARRALARTVAGAADLTLAASTELAAIATRLGAREVRVAPVLVPDLPAATRSADDVRDELGVTGPMVLAVGRLHARMHHDILVAAAARWRDRRPIPQVVLAGTGPAYRDLVAQVATTRAPIVFAGHRDDVADLLGAADLAVVTAERVRPLFALEAARAGVALVAAESSGLVDLLAGSAELVPPGDVDALDHAVRRLLDDPGGRTVLAAAGQARAAAWPSVNEAAGEIAAGYAAVAHSTRDAPGPGR
jgi:glycosyltransferase involved in cell wall biosynthesis